MKLLKYLGVFLLAMLLILGIASIVVPKTIILEHVQSIEAPIEFVNRNIKDFSLWSSWLPFADKDKTLSIDLGSPFSGQDASAKWTSAKIGGGQLRMQSYEAFDSLHVTIETEKQGWVDWTVRLESEKAKTKIFSRVESEVSRPLNVLLYFQKSSMANLLSKAVKNLEKKCQKDAQTGLIHDGEAVFITDWDKKILSIKKDTLRVEEARQFFLNSFSYLSSSVEPKLKLDQTLGYGLFYENLPEIAKTICIAGVETFGNNTEINNSSVIELKSLRAIKTSYKGELDGVSKAHARLGWASKELDLDLAAPIVEHYRSEIKEDGKEKGYQIDFYYLIRE